MNIKHCPSCKTELTENKKLAQGVYECKACSGRFFILITSSNKLQKIIDGFKPKTIEEVEANRSSAYEYVLK